MITQSNQQISLPKLNKYSPIKSNHINPILKSSRKSHLTLLHFHQIFKHYSNQIVNTGKHMTFEKIQYAQNHLTLPAFILFLKDFSVTHIIVNSKIKEIISKNQIITLFKTNSGNSIELTFQQFMNIIQKIAIIYYDQSYGYLPGTPQKYNQKTTQYTNHQKYSSERKNEKINIPIQDSFIVKQKLDDSNEDVYRPVVINKLTKNQKIEIFYKFLNIDNPQIYRTLLSDINKQTQQRRMKLQLMKNGILKSNEQQKSAKTSRYMSSNDINLSSEKIKNVKKINETFVMSRNSKQKQDKITWNRLQRFSLQELNLSKIYALQFYKYEKEDELYLGQYNFNKQQIRKQQSLKKRAQIKLKNQEIKKQRKKLIKLQLIQTIKNIQIQKLKKKQQFKLSNIQKLHSSFIQSHRK